MLRNIYFAHTIASFLSSVRGIPLSHLIPGTYSTLINTTVLAISFYPYDYFCLQ